MFTKDKKYPALEDDSKMKWGKWKDELMSDVPAEYLLWLSNQDWIHDSKNEKLKNYIYNSKEDIKQETGEDIGFK